MRERERERERERNRHTDRHRQRDRETETETERKRTGRQTERIIRSRQAWEKTDTAADRQTHWSRQTGRQTAPEQTVFRQTDTERERERERISQLNYIL